MYSETVREPQLVITTPDPCGHYEATVTPMCGSITGVQTSTVELESELKETTCTRSGSVQYKCVILMVMNSQMWHKKI